MKTIILLAALLFAGRPGTGDWKVLFDGKTLNGWHIYQSKENNSWEVKDGLLHCKPYGDRTVNMRSDLISNDQFENFELIFEWKVAAQGNTGVIYRTTEAFEQPYLSGPEYQLLDDIGYPGKIEDWQKTGACYAMYAPAGAQPKPAGEWNSSRIIVNGTRAEHWLNGKKIVEYEFGSADWNKRKDAGKWKDAKGYGATPKGRIDLQDHTSESWFKNIAIRTL